MNHNSFFAWDGDRGVGLVGFRGIWGLGKGVGKGLEVRGFKLLGGTFHHAMPLTQGSPVSCN